MGILFVPSLGLAAVMPVGSPEVQSYQHRFGVSPHVAERNLGRQARGAGIVEQLETTQGSSYAGVWFDNESGEFVVPTVSEAGRAKATALLNDSRLGSAYRTKPARFTWLELEAAQRQLTKTLLPLSREGLIETSLDPRTNAVVISEAQGASPHDEATIRRAAGSQGVNVEVRRKDVAHFRVAAMSCHIGATRYCSKPLRGGVDLGIYFKGGGWTNEVCTAGFKAVGNIYGNRFVLTAGHCLAEENQGLEWGSEVPNGTFPVKIGPSGSYVFGPSGDWGVINANGSEWDTPSWPTEVAHYWENQEYAIEHEAGSYDGESVCFSGARSGTTCGIVGEMHVEGLVDEISGTTFPPEDRAYGICTQPGDSGGPVFSFTSHTALGLLSASNGVTECSGNSIADYVEITAATENLGVTVAPRAGAVPGAETRGASNIQGTQATLEGVVNPHGITSNYHFDYGTTAGYGQSSSLGGAGSGYVWVPGSLTINSLKGQTTYHYRIVSQNSAGTTYGIDKTFTTPAAPPIVTPEAPTSIGAHSATLNASINPQGSETTYRFEYGPTTAYGKSVPVPDASVGSGTAAVKVSREAASLQAEATYHYRVVATSAEGTSYGSDQTFTTPAVTPTLVSSFGSEGSGNGQFATPAGIVVGGNGNLFVTDLNHGRVQKFGPNGEYQSQFGTEGSGNGQFQLPFGISLDPAGHVFVADLGNHRVQELNANGKFIQQFGPGEGSLPLSTPYDVVADKAGHIFVSDIFRGAVYEYSVEGTGPEGNHLLAVAPYTSGERESLSPAGLGYESAAGNVWGVDFTGNKVDEYQLDCGGCAEHPAFSPKFGTTGSELGQLQGPYDVAARPSGSVLVVDQENNRIQQFTQDGKLLGHFGELGSGSGQLNEPFSIATGKGGGIYVADAGNNRIERWRQPAKPEATTQAASSITVTGATLNASITPVGEATAYHFEYGTTTAYGQSAPVPDEAVGSGYEAVTKSKAIANLQPETTYHFRVVASSVEGTAYGEDMTFKTGSFSIPTALSAMATTEPFNGSSESLAAFSANWQALGWASGTTPKGSDTTSGWGPLAAYPTVNGAFYNTTFNDAGSGAADAATLVQSPANVGRYFSLWLDMPSPSGAKKEGYELRFIDTATATYEVKLLKWVSGSETVLASKSGYSFPAGAFALVDQGGTVSAWTNPTGSGFGQILSASDTAFSGGKGGLEGAGNLTRLSKFKIAAF